MLEVLKIKLDPGAFMPVRAHKTDAGLDLRAKEDTLILAGGWATFDTGVHIAIPEGYFGKLESKSGLNVKHSIVSHGGVIDSGYTGSIKVKLYNHGAEDYHFIRGDKIVQLIIQPYEAPEMVVVNELDDTDRGANGFGSTGR